MTTVTPLDPDCQTAERFLNTLARIQLNIDAREAAEAMRHEHENQPAPVVGERYRRKAA